MQVYWLIERDFEQVWKIVPAHNGLEPMKYLWHGEINEDDNINYIYMPLKSMFFDFGDCSARFILLWTKKDFYRHKSSPTRSGNRTAN